MISKKMQEALNKQINEETFSAYLYFSMAAYFESANLKGFAHWMKIQAGEELFHATKFYNHILERGGDVKLLAIPEPQQKWDSALDAFQAAYKHEQHITKCIHDLTDIAIESKDHAARNLLNWFVDEQVEEEDTANEIVEKLKMIGENGPMLLMLDGEMAARQSNVDLLGGGQAE